MNSKFVLIWATTLLFGGGTALAQDEPADERAEATIRLMGTAEAELPGAVTKEITLPEAIGEDSEAAENAAEGLLIANENRMRREEGLTIAEEARDRAAELAGDALDNREERGRFEDLPELPAVPNAPETPEVPQMPEIPATPAGG